MFKISVVTDEVSQNLEAAAKFAKEFGLNGVELRRVWGKPPQELLNDVDKIKKILKRYGLQTSVIASPFFKSNIDDSEEYEKHLNILKNCIELAKALNCEIVRGFTFWRKGPLIERIDEIIEKFQMPLDILERSDIILGIENEPSTFVGNGEELSLFLDELGSKRVKALWDPGNDVWDQSGEVPYPDGYNHVKSNIVHIHIKDGLRGTRKGGHRFVAFGEGEVDYQGQLKALRDDGYSEYLSLETHWRIEKPSESDKVNINDDDFSNLGEESSRICIRNLLDLINRL